VWLVGAEVARRRVSARTGISVVSERTEFLRAELGRSEPDAQVAALRGAGAMVLPAGLVPSFAAKLNEIAWAVIVEVLRKTSETSVFEFAVTVQPVRA
jgi:hypothetical protein